MPPKKAAAAATVTANSADDGAHFDWTAECKYTLAKYVIHKRAHLKESKKPGSLTKAAKWIAVLADLKGRDEFSELQITSKSLGNHFNRMLNDFLTEKGLTHQTVGRNNSGFKATCEYDILMVQLAQEARQCEAKKKSIKTRTGLKTALSDAVVKAGMATQRKTSGLQIGGLLLYYYDLLYVFYFMIIFYLFSS